jgi:hypothetical protein
MPAPHRGPRRFASPHNHDKVLSNILLHLRADYATFLRVSGRERKTLGEGQPAPFLQKQNIALKEPWGWGSALPGLPISQHRGELGRCSGDLALRLLWFLTAVEREESLVHWYVRCWRKLTLASAGRIRVLTRLGHRLNPFKTVGFARPKFWATGAQAREK